MAITVGTESQLGLSKYAVQEGLAYRITPFNTAQTGKRIDTERMYDNLMNKYKYGGVDKKGIYLDETVLRMCDTHRRLFVQLATELVKEGKNDKALKALNYCEKVIPAYNVPHDFIYGSSGEMAKVYLALGQQKKALEILEALANNSVEYLTWYLSLEEKKLINSAEECKKHLYILNEVCRVLELLKDEKTGKPVAAAVHYTNLFNKLIQEYDQRLTLPS